MKRLRGLGPVLLLIGQAGEAFAQQPADPFRISVNVDMVVLHATVRDQKDAFVTDLRQRDFEVFEDGVRQTIQMFQHDDAPATVGLVIDHSGSMRRKIPAVIAAARMFVKYSNHDDEMFVVNFNERATLGLPGAIRFTSNAGELSRAISRTVPAGQTALYDAVAAALELLREGSRNSKALIVISDGSDNASTHDLAEVLTMAGHASAVVYTIGIFGEEDEDRNPGALSRLARATGGAAFFPDDADGAVAVCERIAREIRQQYTLGYVSSNPPRPGVYRRIRVIARGGDQRKLSVRARSGYYASAAPPVKRRGSK